MLRREQILLSDWLSDWFHYCAEKYDLSYSELIRITLCLQVREWVSKEYPKYKLSFSEREMTRIFRKRLKNERFKEEIHKQWFNLYFEARKTIEFLTAQEKKSKK